MAASANPFAINPHVAGVLDPPTNETRLWVARKEHDRDLAVIDASQAVPSYPPAPALAEHLAREVLLAETAFYTPILGLPALRQALAANLSRHYGAEIGAEEVAITCGGNHAFCMAVQALAGPGDEIILPEPFYFNHQMWLAMQGITARLVPCRETPQGLLVDPGELEAAIGPKTRAIVLVSPNNPTGTIYSPHHIAELFSLARARSIALMLDETYKDFLPEGTVPHELFRDPHWGNTFVFLYSFSKVYSLTGYRVGALAGGPHFINAVAKIADTLTICPPHISQKAALFGLHRLADWTAQKRDELNRRLELLRDAFSRHDPAFRLVSSGAFFAYLKHPFGAMPSLEVSRKLFRELSVLTWPGSFFGPRQEQYVRLAFANSGDAEIEELVRRLAQAAT